MSSARKQTECIFLLRRVTDSARRIPQEEDEDPRLGQACNDTLFSRCTTGERPTRKHGEGAERRNSEVRERERQGNEGSGPDGNSNLKALMQRLLKGWRDRRQSDSEPPRSTHVLELIATLFSADRDPGSCVPVDQRDWLSDETTIFFFLRVSVLVTVFVQSPRIWMLCARMKVFFFHDSRLVIVALWSVARDGRDVFERLLVSEPPMSQ